MRGGWRSSAAGGILIKRPCLIRLIYRALEILVPVESKANHRDDQEEVVARAPAIIRPLSGGSRHVLSSSNLGFKRKGHRNSHGVGFPFASPDRSMSGRLSGRT